MATNTDLPPFPEVPLQTLAVLLAISRQGKARSVARQFGKSVSAITRQVQHLEEELGNVELFKRHSRGMKLTPTGEAYARAAERVLKELKRTQNSLNREPVKRTVRLRGHVSEVLLDEHVFPVVAAFTKNRPHVAIDIIIGAADVAKRAFDEGKVQFAALFGLSGENIEVVKSVECPLIAVVDLDHELATHHEMSAEEILTCGWPVGIPSRGFSTRGIFEKILQNTASTQSPPRLEDFVELTVNSPQHLLPYAMTQQAIVILPELAARRFLERKRLHKIQITGADAEHASFDLCRAHRTGSTPLHTEASEAEKAFFDELKTMFDRLNAENKRRTGS